MVYSCNNQNPFADAVKESITKNALGVDLKPIFKEITTIDTVTVNESIEDWYKLNDSESKYSRDTVKNGIQKLANDYEQKAKQDASVESTAKIWRFKSDRINKLSSQNKDDVDYYVVKAVYSFKNPMLNNADVTFYNIYLFNNDKKLILTKSESDVDALAKEYDKVFLMKYEMLMFSDKYSIPLD